LSSQLALRLTEQSNRGLFVNQQSNEEKHQKIVRPAGLVAALGSVLGGQLTAEMFQTLYRLNDGSEAGGPQADLILSGNTLYGTTHQAGVRTTFLYFR
jgi:hypothetical protein